MPGCYLWRRQLLSGRDLLAVLELSDAILGYVCLWRRQLLSGLDETTSLQS